MPAHGCPRHGLTKVPEAHEEDDPAAVPAALPASAHMISARSAPPEIFKERDGRHLPGEEGVWLFILGDLIVFGLFFITFVIYRSWSPDLYAVSQREMNQAFGVANTLILLTSSWTLATAVDRLRKKSSGGAALIGISIGLGICFILVKIFEYREKIRAGITLNSNEFYTFYYMFTGTHLLHVMLGVGVLGYLFAVSRRDRVNPSDIRTIEGGASFWHLVDILWIVLFALFYLMR